MVEGAMLSLPERYSVVVAAKSNDVHPPPANPRRRSRRMRMLSSLRQALPPLAFPRATLRMNLDTDEGCGTRFCNAAALADSTSFCGELFSMHSPGYGMRPAEEAVKATLGDLRTQAHKRCFEMRFRPRRLLFPGAARRRGQSPWPGWGGCLMLAQNDLRLQRTQTALDRRLGARSRTLAPTRWLAPEWMPSRGGEVSAQ
ncbi:hypothetical protein P153DRAFT_355447 [Dothidotthia symphoricarpi CBS 119687]|uniref:Uncharacterized protein n=1 Tax=Dothidotthia symphoricarpi CBS 119687 TaxID=1392245 RepID=A0A6A6AKR9_9PLEO|nr:uncharacterized protein P153DRAFT_355447 [Dothidotthia symphoricarpi CBS 119687]KAF2131718.1 hypothetical protein P153DRAFT_355447 [Dothidotthia symphoricarpi CBS 119687]